MTRRRFVRTTSAVAALGGAAWITKVAILAATDGDDDSLVVALLYFSGVLGITLGASWIGVRLVGDGPLPLAVALGALGPVLAFVAYDAVLDPLAVAVLGGAGPAWFQDEAGILLTGVVWLAASLPAWLATSAPDPATA